MSVVKRKSVLPIYLVGIVWLLRALFGSLHRPIHFILTAALSVVVYTIGKAIFPDKTVEVKAEEKKADKAEPKKEKHGFFPRKKKGTYSEFIFRL